MKGKNLVCFCFLMSIVLLLGGCHTSVDEPSSPQKNNVQAPMPYVEQPERQTLGKITVSDLSKQELDEKETFALFMTDTGLWSWNENYDLFQSSLVDGTTISLGNYSQWLAEDTYFISMTQFAQTEDGTIWSSFADDHNTAYLVKFNEANHTCQKEFVWKNTGEFIKLIGHKTALYIFRIEQKEETEIRYLLEKYDTKTKKNSVLVEKVYRDKTGFTMKAISLEDDLLYALINDCEKDSYHIATYDLHGNALQTYDLPEYTEEFRAIHKGALDIDVFGNYVGIKSLQNYSTIFQLLEGEAKRIFFTDNRIEAVKRVSETPLPIKSLENKSEEDRYTLFCLDNHLIVYDKEKTSFGTIELDVGNIYPIIINDNLDLLFRQYPDMHNLNNVVYYTTNLRELLR